MRLSAVGHVSSVGDLIEHDVSTTDPDCVCGSDPWAVQRDDGSYAWLLVHHSLDGRELTT